jgi:hypothetical protein
LSIEHWRIPGFLFPFFLSTSTTGLLRNFLALREPLCRRLSRLQSEGKNRDPVRPWAKRKGDETMFNIAGLLTRNSIKGPTSVMFRLGTMLMTILLASASAWAANHQICFEIPRTPGALTIKARFLCRVDGIPGGCTVESVTPDAFSEPIVAFRNVTSIFPRTDGSVEFEAEFKSPGNYTGKFLFGNSERRCTVEIHSNAAPNSNQGNVIGYRTDAFGLVMTGIWEGTSAPAETAFRDVVVPPDFAAVGGGAEGTEAPQGTLLTNSFAPAVGRNWSGGARSNPDLISPPQISPVTTWGIGLKIEGVPPQTLFQMMQIPFLQSVPLFQSTPTVTLTLPPAGTAPPRIAIGGGVQAIQSSLVRQYITRSQPLFSTRIFNNGTSDRVIHSWVAASKDHVFATPGFVRAQMTTLPQVLMINGNTFHVETWVSNATSTVLAHPSATVSLPGEFALTGVGAFVDWQNSPSAAGNMLWKLKPRADINGAEAASKDQWFSSTAAITTFAIGMKLVPGPVPPLFLKERR